MRGNTSKRRVPRLNFHLLDLEDSRSNDQLWHLDIEIDLANVRIEIYLTYQSRQ